MRNGVSWVIYAIIVSSLNLFGTESLPPPLPPLSWKPPAKRPEFAERLKGEEFAKRLKEKLGQIKVEDLAKSTLPAMGALVKSVAPDSQAAHIGMQPGDVIVGFNGQTVSSMVDFIAKRDGGELSWVRPLGECKKAHIEPGKIGVFLEEYFHPEIQYIHSKKRDPKWESYILAASTAFATDQALAETCLRQAAAAGYEDLLLDQIGMWIANVEMRRADEMDFAWRWLAADPKPGLPKKCFLNAAHCSFQYKAGLDMLKQFPDFANMATTVKADLEEELNHLKDLPQEALRQSAPSVATKDYLRDDLLYRAENLGPFDPKTYLNRLELYDFVPMKAPGEQFRTMTFGPGCKSIEAIFVLYTKPTEKTKTQYSRIAGMALLDQDGPFFFAKDAFKDETGKLRDAGWSVNGNIHGILGIRVWEDSLQIVKEREDKFVEIIDFRERFDSTKPTRFRIIISGTQGEIYVNNMRAWYGSVGGPYKRIVPTFKSTGMDAVFSFVRVFELVDPKDKTAEAIRDINKPGQEGFTRLLRSIRLGLEDQVPTLVALGADINIADAHQRSPIQWAAWNNLPKVVDFLMSKGAKMDLFVAATLGKTDKVKEMLKADPSAAQKPLPCGWTAFLGAVGNNYEETARAILEQHPDVNASGPDGKTPLIWATKNGSKSMVEMLLQNGADINKGDIENRTALIFAQAYGKKEIMELLKAKGAVSTQPVRPLKAPDEDF